MVLAERPPPGDLSGNLRIASLGTGGILRLCLVCPGADKSMKNDLHSSTMCKGTRARGGTLRCIASTGAGDRHLAEWITTMTFN